MGKVQKPSGWKDGQLRSVTRPAILESKNEKINLMKQSEIIGNLKKGKGSYKDLPEGVIRSMETKERINQAVTIHGTATEEIRQRLNITGKPLSIKTARAVRDEINDRFEKNRVKAMSKGVDLKGLKKELSKKDQHDVDPAKISKSRQAVGKSANAKPATKTAAKSATKKAK